MSNPKFLRLGLDSWKVQFIKQPLEGAPTYQEEGAAVVVLLQELVFALDGFVGDLFRIVAQFLASFFFRHVAQSFNLLLFFLNSV